MHLLTRPVSPRRLSPQRSLTDVTPFPGSMYTPLTSQGTRLLQRDDDDNDGKLSTTTIIVIVVVCSCVGLLILALFLWRLIFRTCRRSRPTPLPPVQELAHRREQQFAVFADRQVVNKPTAWLGDSLGSRQSQLYHASSALSLLPATPERNSSAHDDEGATAESSSPLPDEQPLHPPNPAFFGTSWDPSSSPHNSFISTTTTASSTAPSPSPSTNIPLPDASPSAAITAADSAQPHAPAGSHGTPPRARMSRSSSRPQADTLNRRLSQMSSATTTHRSIASRNSSVICGPPHSRHSNIQIVLPAPLGPHPLNTDSSIVEHGDRSSVRTSGFADQWVNAGSRSSSVDSRERRRPVNSTLLNVVFTLIAVRFLTLTPQVNAGHHLNLPRATNCIAKRPQTSGQQDRSLRNVRRSPMARNHGRTPTSRRRYRVYWRGHPTRTMSRPCPHPEYLRRGYGRCILRLRCNPTPKHRHSNNWPNYLTLPICHSRRNNHNRRRRHTPRPTSQTYTRKLFANLCVDSLNTIQSKTHWNSQTRRWLPHGWFLPRG